MSQRQPLAPAEAEALTDPLVRAEVDCTDLDGFMLNVERLMASELVALSSHEVIGAALLLWCRAWKQRPAASLPNDDKVIAAFARMPLTRFRKLRDEVLRGFVLCCDGRLYHRTLAAEAANAYERKRAFQRKREADAERLRQWRSGTHRETPSETRFAAEGQGQGQGQVQVQGQGEVIPPTAGGDAPPGPAPSPADTIFAVGLPMLQQASVTDRNARSFLGHLRKLARGRGGDTAVVRALRDCAQQQVLDPVSYLQRCFAPASTSGGQQDLDQLTAGAARLVGIDTAALTDGGA